MFQKLVEILPSSLEAVIAAMEDISILMYSEYSVQQAHMLCDSHIVYSVYCPPKLLLPFIMNKHIAPEKKDEAMIVQSSIFSIFQ